MRISPNVFAAVFLLLGTGHAALSEPAGESVCLSPEFTEAGRVVKARITGSGMDFCIGLYAGERRDCYSWDQKQIHRADEAGIPPAFPDRFLPVKIDGQTLSLCHPACRKIKLDPKVKLKSKSVVRSSLSGHTIIALVEIIFRKDDRAVASFAAIGADGKLVRRFQVTLENPESFFWDFLGETLQVRVCVGAGPGCTSHLFDRAGKMIGLAGKGPRTEYAYNTFDGSEAKYKGDLWLFLGAGSENLALQDVKTGRLHKSFKLQANDVSFGGLVLTDGKSVWVFPGPPAIGQILKVDLIKESYTRTAALPPCTAKSGPGS